MQDKFQSRRDFLKKMALTGSMVTLAASPWLSAFGQTSMVGQKPSDRVRLAIIGIGSRGKQLMRFLFEIKADNNLDIAALCDVYNPHLQEAAKMCNDQNLKPVLYDNYTDLLTKEKVDGVIIVPN
jgi:hypothetical protein